MGFQLSISSIYAIYGFLTSYFRSLDTLPWSLTVLYHGSGTTPIFFFP